MLSYRIILYLIASVLIFIAATHTHAQSGAPKLRPTPTPTPTQREEQEPIKVFTEEVRIPILVTDEQGRFDPTLEAQDVLVLEDDVPQEVRSVRHMPANVLLLLDTSGGINPAMKTSTTRQIALSLVSRLKEGDRVAVLQAGDRAELLQDWTEDTQTITRVLKTKLSSGKRKRLSEALIQAVGQLRDTPAGSRHMVLISDGVETASRSDYEAAVRRLIGAQATVHVISYTAIGRKEMEQSNSLVKFGRSDRRTAGDVAREADPTIPTPGRGPINMTIDTDRAMRRQRKEYMEAMERSEQRLASLAEETGGRIRLPTSTEEMISQGLEVAREIGAQYVVTYTPKRSLAVARAGEYRRVRVVLRRPGLNVRSRSGYVVTPPQ